MCGASGGRARGAGRRLRCDDAASTSDAGGADTRAAACARGYAAATGSDLGICRETVSSRRRRRWRSLAR